MLLTIAQRLLLHLLKHTKERDNYVVSENITLLGIQEELGCDAGYLSRLVKQYEKEELIVRMKKVIKNKKRRYCVFYLTEMGIQIATDIHDNKMKDGTR